MILARGGGRDNYPTPAAEPEHLHSCDTRRFITQAPVGGDHLPLHRSGRSPHALWQHMITHHAGRHLSWHDGAQRAVLLFAAALTLNTQRTYVEAWDRLRDFVIRRACARSSSDFTTVVGYVSDVHLRSTIAAQSMGGCLAPISTIHELARYPSPTTHPIFGRLRKGFLGLNANVEGGLPSYTGP